IRRCCRRHVGCTMEPAMMVRPTILIQLVLSAALAASCSFDSSGMGGASGGGGGGDDDGGGGGPGVIDGGGSIGGNPADAGADSGTPVTQPDADVPMGPCAGCPGPCNPFEGCTINCGPGKCMSEVVCPPGIPCTVDCQAPGSCSAGIDCTQASECTITCDGNNSCNGSIACGEGACSVDCNAN